MLYVQAFVGTKIVRAVRVYSNICYPAPPAPADGPSVSFVSVYYWVRVLLASRCSAALCRSKNNMPHLPADLAVENDRELRGVGIRRVRKRTPTWTIGP